MSARLTAEPCKRFTSSSAPPMQTATTAATIPTRRRYVALSVGNLQFGLGLGRRDVVVAEASAAVHPTAAPKRPHRRPHTRWPPAGADAPAKRNTSTPRRRGRVVGGAFSGSRNGEGATSTWLSPLLGRAPGGRSGGSRHELRRFSPSPGDSTCMGTRA